MKQFYITLLTSLVFIFSASAHVLLYHENFTPNTQNVVTGVYVDPASSWVVTSATPSTISQSSKGSYMRTAIGLDGEKTAYISIPTLGYSSAAITWEQFRNSHNSSNTNFPCKQWCNPYYILHFYQ